jgi:DNA polymerase III sliding clamp (beta) subunit (PCNA family)
VATALCIVPDDKGQMPLKFPGKSAEELRKFLSLAEGKTIKVTVVREDVTFSSGELKTISKVTKFHPIQQEAPNF